MRSEDDVTKAEDRVRGMNLEKVALPEPANVASATDQGAGPSTQQRTSVVGFPNQPVAVQSDQVEEEVQFTPVESTQATSTPSVAVSAGGRHQSPLVSPTKGDSAGFPPTPGKSIDLQSESSESAETPLLGLAGGTTLGVSRAGEPHSSGGTLMTVDLTNPPANEDVTMVDVHEHRRSDNLSLPPPGSCPSRIGRQPTPPSPSSKKRLYEPSTADIDFPENAADIDGPNEALSPLEASPKRQRLPEGLSQTSE